MGFWEEKEVLVTGGAGFIGSHLVEILVKSGAKVTVADSMENGNLQNLSSVSKKIKLVKKDLRILSNCVNVSKDSEIVMNLAAIVGGVGYNQVHPGSMFHDNILLSTQMLEAARINDAERFLAVSSACVYPRFCAIPTPESEGFKDSPEPSNAGYGWAKRMAEFAAQSYAQEYGMKIAIARPYNTYGPRDHFEKERAHVIPSIMMRIFGGENPLVVWGNGKQSRSFVYVEDVARGLALITEKFPEAIPLNIGTDEEVEIGKLVSMLVSLSGKKTEISFDESKPSGQPRRNADTSLAKEKIGFTAKVSLKEGLKNSIDWYVKNKLDAK